MSEHAEFLRYYQEFKDKIYTYVMYRVNFNRATADDLVQEIFIKAFKNFEKFDRERPFSAWIYAIARNHLANFYRSSKHDSGLDGAAGLSVDIRNALEAKNELEWVLKKIQSLDDYSKDVLLMRFVEGLANSEIAEIIGRDEGAVRAQISRALKKLRAELAHNA